MIKKLKSGDLALYKRQDVEENTFVIIIRSMFFHDDKIEYFKCLVNNRTETICELWLKNLKQET